MNNTIKITRNELAEMLKNPKKYRGCSFAGLDMVTEVKLTGGKKNPMQGRVQKVHKDFVVMLFSNKNGSAYGNMVNRRKEQEGKPADFVPGQLTWGERTKDTAHISHTNAKGEYADYVQTIYVQRAVNMLDLADEMGVELNENDAELMEHMKSRVVGYETRNGNVSYLLDGQPIAKEDIEGLPTKKNNGKQGGLSEKMKVIVRTPKLESVTRISMNGNRYEIVD